MKVMKLAKGTPVSLTDLERALEWASADGVGETMAYLHRSTGEVHLKAIDFEEELPADIDDDTRYIPMPNQKDLDLGRELVFEFIGDHGASVADEVRSAFRRKGAYAEFRSILVRTGLLECWYEFQSSATHAALLRSANENGFEVRTVDSV